jgi:hypothetical protein
VEETIAQQEDWSARYKFDERNLWLSIDIPDSDFLTEQQLQLLRDVPLSAFDDVVADTSVVRMRYLYDRLINAFELNRESFTSEFRVIFSRTATLISRLTFLEFAFACALHLFSDDDDFNDVLRGNVRIHIGSQVAKLAMILQDHVKNHFVWLENHFDRVLSDSEKEYSASVSLSSLKI